MKYVGNYDTGSMHPSYKLLDRHTDIRVRTAVCYWGKIFILISPYLSIAADVVFDIFLQL